MILAPDPMPSFLRGSVAKHSIRLLVEDTMCLPITVTQGRRFH